jgi:hypothetical protein
MANPTCAASVRRETRRAHGKQVWSQDGKSPLAAGCKQIVPANVGGQDCLLAFDDKEADQRSRHRKGAVDQPVASDSPAARQTSWNRRHRAQSYLLSYVADSGRCHSSHRKRSSSRPAYNFARKRSPVTTGYTVVKPLVFNGLVYVLAYSFTTGEVDIFSLNVTATLQPGAKPGTPPLVVRPVWIHQWAKNWTHFAFFTLGLENFFFKINVGKINVNIDHINDDPTTGTVEVGTYLQNQLDDPKGVEIVAPFTMSGGDPYFVTYRKDGKADFFRIHSDCQGWTKEAEGMVEGRGASSCRIRPAINASSCSIEVALCPLPSASALCASHPATIASGVARFTCARSSRGNSTATDFLRIDTETISRSDPRSSITTPE